MKGTSVSTLTADMTVGALVAQRLGRARVFERFGIDFCCGGKRPLAEACAARGVPAERVLEALSEEDSRPAEADDPAAMGMGELADHIVEKHHRYLRSELPRLSAMMDKVIKAHGEGHPELWECGQVLGDLRSELEMHMMKEEQVLFPMVHELERAESMPMFHCGTVRNPIRMMEHEHDDAGQALAALRRLTADYTPPADACTTYRVLLYSLAELERDMRVHIHKENNVLFPRAAEAEVRLAAGAR